MIAAIAVLSIGASVAAPAAADWTAPVAISRPHGQVGIGGLAHTAMGGPVAWWTWYDDGAGQTAAGWGMASGSTPDVGFGPERALPDNLAAGPKPYGSSRVVVATQTDRVRLVPVHRVGSTLHVRFGDLAGRFGRPQLVVRRPHAIRSSQLAVNAPGDGALAWSEYRPGRDAIYVSLRRRGGAFGPPILLGRGAIRGISAAVGPAGDVLVAWDARGRVRTRFKLRAGSTFRPVDELRAKTTFSAALQTAVSERGRAWVAWTSQLRTEGGTIGDAYIQVARRPAGAARFDAALLLDHGLDGGRAFASPVSLAAGPRGTAALAWTMKESGFTSVAVADITAAGLARIKQLARFDATEHEEHAAVTYAGDGTPVVAWTQPPDAQSGAAMQAFSSQRQAGGGWGAPRLVSAGPVSDLELSSAPGGGTPTLLLAQRGDGASVVQAVALGVTATTVQ